MAEETQEGAAVELKAVSSKRMQPKWKNPPSRIDLKDDYDSAESGQEELRAKLIIYAETLEGGAPLSSLKKGKSTARPMLARENAEWKYPSLTEPILSTRDLFKISPVGGEDKDAAKQNSLVLNNQWTNRIAKTQLVDNIARSIVDEGTCIVKTGWDTVEGTKMVEAQEPVYATAEESLALMQEQIQTGQLSPEKAQAMLEVGEPVIKGYKTVYVEEETLVKNQPAYEVCSIGNVTIDPTCDGIIADAMFVIHEYETSYSDLKADEYAVDEDGEEWGFYYNLDMVLQAGEGSEDYDPAKSDASNTFKFKDDARKKLKAYEYWGYWDIQGDGVLVAIVATWIGSTLVRLEENPFPHGRIPFSVATYMPVKREIHGEPDAHLLRDQQESVGKMTRAIHDITAQHAVGQEFIDERFFPSPSQKNAYEKGNTVYFRSGFDASKAIYKNSVQQVGNTPFDVINWQERKAKEISGTKGIAGGGAGGKLGADSKGKDSLDAVAKRELSILRRIAAMLVDMARLTIAMNQVFLDEEEIVRITGDEFVAIRRDDLEGNFDLSVEISTPEKDEDQANKIMKLMQTNAANMDPEIVKIHYIQMAELWKLPALADSVRDYKPQPNPQQEELLALQVEEAKLKNAVLMKTLEDMDSKVFERLSRTDENQTADKDMKNAKARQSNAAAEKLEAETDVINQEFLNIESGNSRAEDLQDKAIDADNKLREKAAGTSSGVEKKINFIL